MLVRHGMDNVFAVRAGLGEALCGKVMLGVAGLSAVRLGAEW